MNQTGTRHSDVLILRDLAKQYAVVVADPIQKERRDLWRQHNSLLPTRPLIYLRGGQAYKEILKISDLHCEDEFYRVWERSLRQLLFWAAAEDDSVFEPWIRVRATFKCTGWGVKVERHYSDEAHGSYKRREPIKDLDKDIENLRCPHHIIDEDATRREAERIGEAIGDIVPVIVDRGPLFRMWGGDMSMALGELRGIEHMMLDMMDNPSGLHRLMGILRDGILGVHEEAEATGDWTTVDHENQAMTYAEELPDPANDLASIKRKNLWGFQAAQEFALVSPAMHEEFLLEYQIPILEKFGLVAYGCCEDLTRKIDMLRRRIPNLRRIAVSPMANLDQCAEQIGTDYVISWRPSPAEMVCTGFDPERIRQTIRHGIETCRSQHMDITLKDVETVQNEPQRLPEWVRITRQVIDEYY